MEKLQSLRRKIEKIDLRLLDLIVARLRLAPQFARVKYNQRLPLRQIGRERELLERYKLRAKRKQMDEKMVERIFKILMHASLKEQEKFLKKKI